MCMYSQFLRSTIINVSVNMLLTSVTWNRGCSKSRQFRVHMRKYERALSPWLGTCCIHSRLHLGGGSTGLQGRHRRRLPRVALNYWSVSCHRRTAADTLWYQTLTHLRVVWHCPRAPAASRCRPPVDGSSSRSSAYLRRRIPN